jgi:hypothetical protein
MGKSLEAYAETEPALEELRATNARLLRALDKAEASKEELIDAVYRASRDAMSSFEVPTVPKPNLGGKPGTPHVAVAIAADWQLAKRTPSYNTAVCEKRVKHYAQVVNRLTEIHRNAYPVNECRLYLLGDLVEGEMIFPGQAHRIDASLYRQVLVDGPRILVGLVRSLLATFSKVHVVGVIGNHGAIGGRDRKDMHPETNADSMMYETSRLILENEPRLTWDPNMLAGERKWCAVDKIGEKRYLLFHGDQAKGGGGIGGLPFTGLTKAVLKWSNGGINEPFDYAFCGHHHTPTKLQIGNKKLWVSGSTESDNTYASEWFHAQGAPTQWLFFAHPRRGIVAPYEVDLSEAR